MKKAYFPSVIGDETAVADGIESAEPARLENLLARVLGDDAEDILLAARLDALKKLLGILGVESFEGLASYDTIGGYSQHCLNEGDAWCAAAPYPIYQDVGDALVFDAIGFPAVPVTTAKDGDGIVFGDKLHVLCVYAAIMVLVVTLGLPGFQRYAHVGRTALVIGVVYVTSLEGEDEICKRLNLCHIFSVLSFFILMAKIGVSILFDGTKESLPAAFTIAKRLQKMQFICKKPRYIALSY